MSVETGSKMNRTNEWRGTFDVIDAAVDHEAWGLAGGTLYRLAAGDPAGPITSGPRGTRLAVGEGRVALAGEALWLLDASSGAVLATWRPLDDILALAVEDSSTVVVVGADSSGHPSDRCAFLQRFRVGLGGDGSRTELCPLDAPPDLPVTRPKGMLRLDRGQVLGPGGALPLGEPALQLVQTPGAAFVRGATGVTRWAMVDVV